MNSENATQDQSRTMTDLDFDKLNGLLAVIIQDERFRGTLDI